jgi:hypothetical protein
MPARLELNPVRYVSWKGKTFNQVTSSTKKNTYTLGTGDNVNIFNPTPLKLYRKEIASTAISTGNSRRSSSIQDFERPNGYIISSPVNSNGDCVAVNNNLDINIQNSKYDNGTAIQLSTNPNICFSHVDNARRRCRSGGAAIKQYDITNRKTNYYTSSTQYLYDRNKTFDQNMFGYQSVFNADCDKPTVNPSNGRFKTQGGVSASDYIARTRYEEIKTAADRTANAYGAESANALAYGVNDTPYTKKDQRGFSINPTPVVDKITGEFKRCTIKKISHAT